MGDGHSNSSFSFCLIYIVFICAVRCRFKTKKDNEIYFQRICQQRVYQQGKRIPFSRSCKIIPLNVMTHHQMVERDKLGVDEDEVGEEAGDEEDEG